MLTIEGVSKHYGGPQPALDGVSLTVPRGQMVGILGRSGAGKSTLLRIVNRLVEPTSGRVLEDECDVTALRGRRLLQWRADCAMIFQQFHLVGRLDVLTNVLLGRLRHRGTLTSLVKWFSREERLQALAALDRLDLLPQALQRAETLSGGQQQRVAIARALLQEPRILLADEPVASLDPRSGAAVMEALAGIRREGTTVLCNLHAVDLARSYCERIVGLASGRVVFDGPPEALTEEHLDAIYGRSPQPAAGRLVPTP